MFSVNFHDMSMWVWVKTLQNPGNLPNSLYMNGLSHIKSLDLCVGSLTWKVRPLMIHSPNHHSKHHILLCYPYLSNDLQPPHGWLLIFDWNEKRQPDGHRWSPYVAKGVSENAVSSPTSNFKWENDDRHDKTLDFDGFLGYHGVPYPQGKKNNMPATRPRPSMAQSEPPPRSVGNWTCHRRRGEPWHPAPCSPRPRWPTWVWSIFFGGNMDIDLAKSSKLRSYGLIFQTVGFEATKHGSWSAN